MAYTKVNFQDLPNTTTPVNATNLGHMDDGIKANDDKLLGNTAMGDIKPSSITIDGHKMFFDSKILYFTNGEATWDSTDLGLSEKPLCLVMTSCNQNLSMQYDYDNSSATSIKIIVDSNYSGLLRFSYIMLA